ncbi:hypothetical protein [Streptosporangium sp. 'caverna']|uniref:hypothetical protein n=1 Tax=Streptosporangium sp. 'caverna' TaxID=2202249 RepID=UPI000D7D536E|nr:hypothetical protein [Streptosporangium sp. 'caverna']AWS42824.1 hypothetical protein DKM19_17090 [Streptosporangium sp. 'caverna']
MNSSRPSHNAICLGGPCHGMLTHIDQDIGILTVPVPRRSPEEPEAARYRVTRERVHHPCCAEPFIALYWAEPPDPADSACPCGC